MGLLGNYRSRYWCRNPIRANHGKFRCGGRVKYPSLRLPHDVQSFSAVSSPNTFCCHGKKAKPFKHAGSYAGAMGFGQFIPSSYRSYAVDFDGDGVRDIWANKTDAIGSVANYFAEHGWRVLRAWSSE